MQSWNGASASLTARAPRNHRGSAAHGAGSRRSVTHDTIDEATRRVSSPQSVLDVGDDEPMDPVTSRDALLIEGRRDEVDEQLDEALAFYRRVGATLSVATGEALLGTPASDRSQVRRILTDDDSLRTHSAPGRSHGAGIRWAPRRTVQRTSSDTSRPRMTVANTNATRVWPITVRRIRVEVTVTSVVPKVVLTAMEK